MGHTRWAEVFAQHPGPNDFVGKGFAMRPLEISRRALIASGIGSFATCLVGNSWIEALAAGETPTLPHEAGLGPWNYWLSDEGTGVIRIASAAILVSNPRNIQPWLFRLADKQIEIMADNKVGLRLGALDAIQREVYIGLGCAIENACVAAPSQGLKAEVLLLPDPARPELAAALKFQTDKPAKHRHHDAIGLRHTNRSDYRLDRPIDPATMDALAHEATSPDTRVLLLKAASPEGKIINDLMIEATKQQFDMPAFSDLLHAGARTNLPKNATEPDIAASLSKADAQNVERMRKSCATAACFGLIMVRGSRLDHCLHLEAGRLWQRIHLEGSTRGLGMQPLNHPIQIIDYEVANHQQSDLRTRLLKLPGNWNGWEPIFGFRFGYTDSVAPLSARRPLSAVVIS
jgi:hypothetical protein